MSAGESEQKVPEKKRRGRRRKPRPLGKNGKEISASAAKLRLLKRLRCTLKFEKELWAQGATLIAGVDEVGRGALFGPVVAAAVPAVATATATARAPTVVASQRR